MKTRPDRRKREQAYTLVEVMIGALVVGVLFSTYLVSLKSGVAIMRGARENLRATQIMVNRIEGIRLYRWDQLTDTNMLPTTFTEYEIAGSTNASQGIIYTGTVAVATANLNPSATFSSDMYAITVQVQWASDNVLHARQMSTYQAKNGIQNYVYSH